MKYSSEKWRSKSKKKSAIYTPDSVSQYLYDIIPLTPQVVFDPCIGQGSLTAPWRETGSHIIGMDIQRHRGVADYFIEGNFLNMDYYVDDLPPIDFVCCNPPFNGAPKHKLYPELFLRRIIELFGSDVPIVLFSVLGMRLNCSQKSSKRLKWFKEQDFEITSIISLPVDTFKDGDRVLKFPAEILCFNIPDLKPHYFLGDEINIPCHGRKAIADNVVSLIQKEQIK